MKINYNFHDRWFHVNSQSGVRLVLLTYDQDDGNDDLLDILHIPISVNEIQEENSQFSPVTLYTGIFGVGTAEFSFRVQCDEGFCGRQCDELCNDGTALKGQYLIEVAIHSWKNPSRGDAYQGCCDVDDFYFPDCGNDCDTRFEFCVQPFRFPVSSQNCLFGAYEERFTETWLDPDNISFVTGQDLESGASNPMTFYVQASEMVSLT